jgi:hypothetical protein
LDISGPDADVILAAGVPGDGRDHPLRYRAVHPAVARNAARAILLAPSLDSAQTMRVRQASVRNE